MWTSPTSRRAGLTVWRSVRSYITSTPKRSTTPNSIRKIDAATFDWRSTLPSKMLYNTTRTLWTASSWYVDTSICSCRPTSSVVFFANLSLMSLLTPPTKLGRLRFGPICVCVYSLSASFIMPPPRRGGAGALSGDRRPSSVRPSVRLSVWCRVHRF